uniref:Zinc transporter ZIP3 n=1 Tax=Rhabditophanes sp. KR3021 TaxID=114890 RepID=A0AC35U5T7_9BILA
MLFFIVFGLSAFIILATTSTLAFKYAKARLVNTKYVSTPTKSVHNQTTFIYFACGVFMGTCFLGLFPHVQQLEHLIKEEKMAASNHTFSNQGNMHENPPWYWKIYSANFLLLIGFTFDALMHQLITFYFEKHNSSELHFKTFVDKSIKYSVTRNFTLTDNPDDDPVEGSWNLDEPSDCLMDELEAINFRQPIPQGPSCHNFENVTLNGKDLVESIVFLFALSIHSIFEGMALGAQKHDKLSFTLFFAAIMLHEVLCATSFGFIIAKNSLSLKVGCAMIAFLAACIPFGLLIESLISSMFPTDSKVFTFVLLSICCGIFLYEICVEILGKDNARTTSISTSNPTYNDSNYFNLFKILYFSGGLFAITCANIVIVGHIH